MNVVHGYIHNAQHLFPIDNPYYNIPELIIQIVLIFYHIKECWDKKWCDQYFKIDGCMISKKKSVDGYITAFLTQTISSGVHYWKFKISKRGSEDALDIGIVKHQKWYHPI